MRYGIVGSRGAALALASVLVLSASRASADEAKVEVTAAVVLASNDGNQVDPQLVKMRDTFAKSGVAFRSYRLISQKTVALTARAPAEVSLPNGLTATVSLEALDKGTARLKVRIPPTETVYSLGREGSLFVDAGTHANGRIFLVLSPAK